MERLCSTLCLVLAGLVVPALASAQQFQTAVYYDVARHGQLWGSVAADFNNDGNLDVAIADQVNSKVDIMLGAADGTFQPASRFRAEIATGIAAGDLNGDGKVDLVVTRFQDPGNIGIYFGNGDGTFHLSTTATNGRQPIGVAIADLNGDGHSDFAVANSNTAGTAGNIMVFLNHGDGTFASPVRYGSTGHPWSITAGDLNGDGHVDLVVTKDNYAGASGKNTLAILLNNGDGSFVNLANYSIGIEVMSAAIGDLNHDGKPDLAVADDSRLTVLLGNGDGTFGTPTFYKQSLGQAPNSVVIADFNLDGTPDLAIGMLNGESIANTAIFYGNGDGTFQTPLPINAHLEGGNSMVSGDFDHDGAPDLAMPIWLQGTLSVMLNAQ